MKFFIVNSKNSQVSNCLRHSHSESGKHDAYLLRSQWLKTQCPLWPINRTFPSYQVIFSDPHPPWLVITKIGWCHGSNHGPSKRNYYYKWLWEEGGSKFKPTSLGGSIAWNVRSVLVIIPAWDKENLNRASFPWMQDTFINNSPWDEKLCLVFSSI